MAESTQHLRFLTKVDLTGNKITKLRKILCPELKNLVLDQNEIAECELNQHTALEHLSLNKNKLVSLAGLANLTNLKTLSVSENENLTSISGITNCPNLKKLVVSANPKLEGFDKVPDLPGLEEITLNGCPIAKVEDVEKLGSLKNLKAINIAETPLAEEKGDDIKKEILIALDQLKIKTVNGEEITAEEVADAKNEKKERIKAAEEARKAAEEEAKAAAAAAEGAEAEAE
uniref:Uncharacterized protein n=1 Tax=Strombidium inclinatum TaxID=197538 RepID=A0A7S3IV55_9SPIT|mmetsp:Transcript_39979/g.61185  ORF Transcript_39979/g.61185 Transcript_39979/m.61185 type:complete len:231 (+) Transcript_39979:321-1013(+)